MDIHEVRNALYNSVIGPGTEAFAALKRNIREEIIPPLMKQQMDVAFKRAEGVINAANRYTYFPNGISLGVVLAVNLFKLLRMVFVRSMKYYRNRRKKSARQRNEKKECIWFVCSLMMVVLRRMIQFGFSLNFKIDEE